MLYLISLIAVAGIAGIFWSFQKKLNKRTTERAREFEVLLSELKRNPNLADSGIAGAAAPTAMPTSVVQNPGLGKKPRLLPQSGALLYMVLRTGLPDHEIFANLTLADLIDIEPVVSGFEREQKARRLAQHRLDLVICTKQLEVVAAVLLDAAQADNTAYIDACMQAAGIRLLRFESTALPRHQQVRNLVYGSDWMISPK